jgi:hypothetical protein
MEKLVLDCQNKVIPGLMGEFFWKESYVIY